MNRAEQKRAALRSGLSADRPLILVGAHDAMSAHLAERAGFEGIWVSGFGVATMTHALPDLNLVTMTEALAAAKRIDDATDLPVIADCDNGFGSLVNVVRTLVEYERAGIAGICVEDNLFPKRNSLFQGQSRRDLISPREQARRIEAAKRAQNTKSFVFIARVEALIAGHGVQAACDRAERYGEAGADAILIHSKDKSLRQIRDFLDAWKGRDCDVPLVAVPTLFPDFTAEELYQLGFQVVIWANQLMRASVQSMEQTLATLTASRKVATTDPDIAPVNHIFELVKTQETIELEEAGAEDAEATCTCGASTVQTG
jgi:phosphoenolpyruvate phosphomutase